MYDLIPLSKLLLFIPLITALISLRELDISFMLNDLFLNILDLYTHNFNFNFPALKPLSLSKVSKSTFISLDNPSLSLLTNL